MLPLQLALRLFLTDRLHDPVVDVAEHVGVNAMVRSISVHADRQAGRVEQLEIRASRRQRNDRVGNAVPDEDAELANLRQP